MIELGEVYNITRMYSEEISREVARTIARPMTTKTIPCTASREEPGVGLWQWVVDLDDG